MLNALQVPRMGDLLTEAQAIYRRHEAEFDVENPWDGLFGSIKEFEPLDQEFCKSTKPGKPAMKNGKPIASRLMGRVHHTFVEGSR